MNDLQGKTAVVTGGASGIGLAMARAFKAAGMKLVLADIEQGPLDAAVASLGADVIGVRTDVSKGADVAALADKAFATFGSVEVLCNNAGVGGQGGPCWAGSEADWNWALGVNLWGVIHGLRSFVPRMIAQGSEGHIVNTASMAGLTATPFLGPYTAAKHAVVALSEVLVKDLELVGSKLRVSVLCPGFVKTQIAESHRNRPVENGAPVTGGGKGAAAMANTIRALVDGGITAESVADQVLKAVRADHFYVLTHPEMKPAIAQRMKDILEERSPKIDDLMRAALTPKRA